MKAINITEQYLQRARGAKDTVLRHISTPLVKLGLHPNMITIMGFALGIISTFFVFRDHTLFVVFGLGNIILDNIDGHVARQQKRVTRLGTWMDFSTDAIIALLLWIQIIHTYHYITAYISIALLFSLIFYVYISRNKEGVYPFRTFLFFMLAFDLHYLASIIHIPIFIGTWILIITSRFKR